MILIIKHISIEGPGIIATFFQNNKWQLRTIELEEGNKLPDNFRGIKAIITLGGPMNVYEEEIYPFLKDENRLLKKAIKEEIPILGICLGAQLLAKACGSKVKRAEDKEVGWYKINLTEEGKKDFLFRNAEKELDVFQWHEDTFDIPKRGVLLATSHSCKNQMFRFGKNSYGLQFHIEVTPEMIKSWIREYVDNSNQSEMIDTQRVLIEACRKKEQFVEQANNILLNFSRIITGEIADG